jgi:hypothetical protein
MMNESEVKLVKNLLKDKNHDYWKDAHMIEDLHRHSKYTIRKITK